MSCSVCAVKVGSLSLSCESLSFSYIDQDHLSTTGTKKAQTKLHSTTFCALPIYYIIFMLLWKELYGYRGYTIILMFKTVSLNFNKTAVSVCTCLYLQAFRDKMCLVPARDPPNTGGPKSSGLCLPPSLLCLCNVQQTAGHRRWVLPHGGRKTCVQGGLWNSQTKWWEIVFSHDILRMYVFDLHIYKILIASILSRYKVHFCLSKALLKKVKNPFI